MTRMEKWKEYREQMKQTSKCKLCGYRKKGNKK